MKIAVVSDDKVNIASHFGRANGFVIIRIIDNKIMDREYRENRFTNHLSGGNDDPHAKIVEALSDCKAVISHGMGKRIYDDLRIAGIESIITEEESVEKAISLYLKEELKNHPELGCTHQGEEGCDHH